MRATSEMKEAWRECAIEIRAESGHGTGLLERALKVGDGTGRSWRRWMAPQPPMPRKWWDLAEEALRLGWVSNQAAQALIAAVQAAEGRLEKFREREVERRSAPPIEPPELPFDLPPPVPRAEFLDLFKRWPAAARERVFASLDSRWAASLLIRAAKREAQKVGVRAKVVNLQKDPQGSEWLRCAGLLKPLIAPTLKPADLDQGRPKGNPGHERNRQLHALLDELQAAYERLGYPPPSM